MQAVTCRYSGRTQVPGVLSNRGLYIGKQIWYPIYVIAVFVTRNFGGGVPLDGARTRTLWRRVRARGVGARVYMRTADCIAM
eukprot:SAG31_NODE_29095_length_400_cov_15.843854_1_plen_81_part_10